MVQSTEDDDGEEDYMNMVIAEPAQRQEKETYTQRRLRKEREVGSINNSIPFATLTLRLVLCTG